MMTGAKPRSRIFSANHRAFRKPTMFAFQNGRDSDEQQNRSWYVIHTNPRQENRASSNLMAWNVETFAPQLKEHRYNQYTGESGYVIKPLFPGYIFARFSPDKLLHKVRYTRGVHSLVSFGEGPASVSDEIIGIIRSQMGKDGAVRIADDLKPGDRVMVKDGPLKNFTGMFEREMNDSERVMVLLDLVSYQTHIEINKVMLKKVQGSDCNN